jgi:ribosome-associated translation inhibitor RaiA
MNMFAAVDIVETKLKLQIKKYKESHGSGKLSRHLTAKFRRSQANNLLLEEPEASS